MNRQTGVRRPALAGDTILKTAPDCSSNETGYQQLRKKPYRGTAGGSDCFCDRGGHKRLHNQPCCPADGSVRTCPGAFGRRLSTREKVNDKTGSDGSRLGAVGGIGQL